MSINLKKIVKKFLKSKNYFKLWFEDKGDQILKFEYKLNSDSVFFELGGYKGTYASNILSLFNPHTYIFEPSQKYYEELNNKFKNFPNVKVINSALSNKSSTSYLVDYGESSYVSKVKRENSTTIKIIKLSEFIKKNKIKFIDLLNINIEGSEYKVLNDLLNNKCVGNINSIQIQFHKNVRFYRLKRKIIHNKLNKTHKLIWCYNFVWERWDLK